MCSKYHLKTNNVPLILLFKLHNKIHLTRCGKQLLAPLDSWTLLVTPNGHAIKVMDGNTWKCARILKVNL